MLLCCLYLIQSTSVLLLNRTCCHVMINVVNLMILVCVDTLDTPSRSIIVEPQSKSKCDMCMLRPMVYSMVLHVVYTIATLQCLYTRSILQKCTALHKCTRTPRRSAAVLICYPIRGILYTMLTNWCLWNIDHSAVDWGLHAIEPHALNFTDISRSTFNHYKTFLI